MVSQGISGKAMVFEGMQYFAHHGIGLDDKVAIISSLGLSVEFLIGNNRIVGGVES